MKKVQNIFILVIFGTVILWISISRSNLKEDLNENGKVTIARVSGFQNDRVGNSIKYTYYVGGKRLLSTQSENKIDNYFTGDFYIVKYSINEPENSVLYLNNKIDPDSITLTKAGFKYVKYSEHDYKNGDYIIKYKWQ